MRTLSREARSRCMTVNWSLVRPAFSAAFTAFEKSRQAMTTCQSPDLASAMVVFKPSPEEEPVMMATFLFPTLSETGTSLTGELATFCTTVEKALVGLRAMATLSFSPVKEEDRRARA